jgi:NADH-quinone oxidoreductase subunit J
MPSFFFYLFAAILIGASLAVIFARNPIYNVLALVVVIFCLSCLFVLLEAFFVGVILLLVYAGAVMVFFLFVVMCLDLKSIALASWQKSRLRWLGALAGLAFASCFFLSVQSFIKVHTLGESSIRGTIEALGHILFTDYLLPFELTSLLLLIAIFGIVSLSQGALNTGKAENS